MITAGGILQGFAEAPDLPFHPVYLAMAIGAGSKPIAWMNDSGFWIMCKMSGMTESEGLRTVSPWTIAMGYRRCSGPSCFRTLARDLAIHWLRYRHTLLDR